MSVDWQDHVSQPTYSMKVTKRVLVPMRDGVHLSIDLFAPDGEGPFPALLSYSPYWNEGQYLPVPPSNPHPTAGLGNYAIVSTSPLGASSMSSRMCAALASQKANTNSWVSWSRPTAMT